ncbi:hypothetical protein BT69DRAFT_642313 [Atractiella rhizophila]|nr:hypothetical protein BT69DRAFT_642313 [Atractiella rhizophila]
MNVSSRGRNPAFDFPYQIYIVIIDLRKIWVSSVPPVRSHEHQTLFISVELTIGPSCPDVLLVLCCWCVLTHSHQHSNKLRYECAA